MIYLAVRKEKFQQGVAFAKYIGCKFDPERKAWRRSEAALWAFVDASKRADQTREGFLRANGLEIAADAPADAAATYRGQASMDAANSIF